MSSTDETLNRSGSFKMSPTPFRGVMTLEETIQASPPVQGNTTSDAISNNPQDALMESGTAPTSTTVAPPSMSSHRELLRSRKAKSPHHVESKRHRRRRRHSKDFDTSTPSKPATWLGSKCNACVCACDRTFVRSTLSCMNLLARLLFWCSAMASVAAVVWYSYELKKHGYVLLRSVYQ